MPSLWDRDYTYYGKEPTRLEFIMTEKENDFGFSFTSEEEHKFLIQNDADQKARAIKALVMPLLVNLMKNPDKEMIKWPDRAPKIQAIIDKINELVEEGT
jgi:hypothetical protein